ncbi:MAG: 4-azaleucine resistance transporter AzlC [Cellvibrionaceae bacterium]|jgi:4-azaleucine resistance transporter AzlC
MSTPQVEFKQGMKDISPVLFGVIPFGLISGITAVAVGLTAVQAIGMGFIVVAGASQLAALELLQGGASFGIIILTVAIINLRHLMYSAGLAPHFRNFPLAWRLFLPYLMVDQVFILSSIRFNKEPDMKHKRWYYLGLATAILTTWHSSAVVGVLVGAQLPPSWSLDFTIPLMFMFFIFPTITDRPTVVAAISAGVMAIVLRPLPLNLGFITAAMIGVVIAVVWEQKMPFKQPIVQETQETLEENLEGESNE